jgi:lipid II:glycine glycyltransferase (peptidoglycan interpeptide bridge formation enzyme)
VLFLN